MVVKMREIVSRFRKCGKLVKNIEKCASVEKCGKMCKNVENVEKRENVEIL